MRHGSRRFRLAEILLCLVGITLLGVAGAETWDRWKYQADQERALAREPAVSVSAPLVFVRTPAVSIGTATLLSSPPSLDAAVRTESPALEQETSPGSNDGQEVVEPVAISTPKRTKRKAAGAEPALGRIEIPRLGMEAIVKEGDDEKTLARAVGLVRGSARPGELGNIVLAGHRDTFFRPLRKIKVDDRIRMIVPPHTYEYRVQSMRVVSPEETSVLESNGVEELTLVTCYPFFFIGPAPDRFIVKAARIN